MPINVGDAVLTFLGDSTQLDAAFDRVNSEAESKVAPATAKVQDLGSKMSETGMKAEKAAVQHSDAWTKVADLTVKNTAAQQSLRAALDLVAQTGDKDAVAMALLAQQQKVAAQSSMELALATREAANANREMEASTRETTGAIALGGELVGVRMPRHLRHFVAELPGVGAALNAAFSFIAVAALIGFLVEGIKKLSEWGEHAEKLREGWAKLEATFADTSIKIVEDLEKQEEKFVSLTEGPVAALDYAFKHLHSTALQALKSINAELEAASQQFKDKSPWHEFFTGWAQGARDLKEFNTELTEAMYKAKQDAPGDEMAPYRAGLEKTYEKLFQVQDEMIRLERIAKAGYNADLANDATYQALQKQYELLTRIADQMAISSAADEQRRKNAAEEERRAAQSLGIARATAVKLAAEAELALDDEKNKILFERGRISYERDLELLKASEEKKYELAKTELSKRLALTVDPAQQAGINGQLEALESTHQRNLMQLDEEAYKHGAEQHTRYVQKLIAATRQGSQERVELEQGLLLYYAMTWGEESAMFQEQLTKVAEAQKSHTRETKKLADEEAKSEEALAADKQSSTEKYYAYLSQSARASAADLLKIQQQSEQGAYDRKKAALTRQLNMLGEDEVIARKKINGELELLDQQHQEQIRLFQLQTQDTLEGSYKALGLKSAELWDREVKQAQEAYGAIRNSATASLADVLKAQQKVLELSLGKALSQGDQPKVKAYTIELAKLEQQMAKMGLTAKRTQASMSGWLDDFAKKLRATRGELHGFQSTFDTVIGDASNVFGNAITQWIVGQKSLGEALREGLAAELATIAGKSAAWALYFAAWGIADLFWNPARAGADFAAAGEFAALAGIAGAAAYAIAPHGGKDSGGSNAQTPQTSSADGIQQGPTQAVNVPHFAEGGLVSRPTLAIIGDSTGRGGADELALPLDNPQAMGKLADSLVPRLAAAIGANVRGNTFHIEGVISDDNLRKVIQKIDHAVTKNGVALTSSNSMKVTRRA